MGNSEEVKEEEEGGGAEKPTLYEELADGWVD